MSVSGEVWGRVCLVLAITSIASGVFVLRTTSGIWIVGLPEKENDRPF